ncbi:restriction endonuclease subunit S [uncultured Alistipes sp.]|uniref:restriction endonuclease subunit S n=1 Tax=uncultured Alistipes sp. TaxID=538949 RepID=UPI00261C302F|nr:restriction endonuclease subunit S [uncultured Alistipes sp.]
MGNNIPQGYKATALGIIPQEWKTIRLKDCFSISAGGDVQKDCFSEAPSLQYKYPIYSNSLFNHGLYGFTSHPRHKANSITITGRGALGHAEYREIDFDAIVRLLVLAPKIPLNGQYITEYINFRKPFFYESTGVPQLTAPQIANIQVLFPPLGEQRKIAEVLGVWDEAIEKQARLIEKLALRKRGLMQRLLSAKLRLPGFSEPWKIHKLQELFTERNETNRTDLPLLSITGDRGVILQTESEKRDTSNDDKSKYKRIAKGDIGYNTMRMWQGRSALSGLEGIVSPAYTIVVPNTDVDGYYMSVLFKQPRLIYDFWTHSQGLVGDTLNCKYRDFGQVHICCPPLAEQKAITEVLTAADREIELAKEKLERLRRQKRGLMQQLLSGKKRVKINI